MFEQELIIGYDPKLSYSKDKSETSEVNNTTPSLEWSGINYKNYSPDIALTAMSNSVDLIESLIKKTSAISDSKDISVFLNEIDNNKEYVQDILSKNSNISGDSIFEILYILKNLQIRAKNIVKLLKKMYYGKEDIQDSEIELINSNVFARIKQYDQDQKTNYKVSYGILNMDSKLNKSLELLSYSINATAQDISNVYGFGSGINVNSSLSNTVSNLFDEINTQCLLQQTSLDNNSAKMLLEKSFYNYYSLRKEFIQMGNLCYETQDSIPFLLNFLSDKQSETEEAIELLLKNNEWYNNKVSSITSLLAQREQLKKIYNQSELN